MSYKTRISASKDEKAKASIDLEVAEAKAQVENVIATEKLKQTRSNAAYEALLGASPFSVEKVLQVQADMAASKARLVAAQELLKNEFAD